jgi:tetratricopeptide (TPR) repeat protein
MIHVATTDHRIPRRTDRGVRSVIRAQDPGDGQESIVNYHRELMDDRERAATQRDVGVALCRTGREGAAMALPLLEQALEAHPSDVTAWEAKGFALGLLNLTQEGLAAFKTALALAPNRESTLTGAAYLATKAELPEQAVAYWRRAITINPWRSDYHAELAPLYFQLRDWRAAADSCRKTLRLNPTNLQIRKLLIRSSIRLGDPEAARRELDTLLGFDPPDRDDLLRWFTPLARPEP